MVEMSKEPAPPNLSDAVCPGCGYSLRGIESERCPECGLLIDRTGLGESRLPWAHRRTIGRLRAFWRTVWLVTFHPRRLAGEMNHGVSYADARMFQWICVVLALVPVMAALAPLDPNRLLDLGVQFSTLDRAATVAVLGLGLMLFLLTASGVASYFFHPRSLPVILQNRAIALSYYGSAALAWTPLVVALTALALGAEGIGDLAAPVVLTPMAHALSALAIGAAVFQVAAWWLNTFSLLRWTTHCGAGRLTAIATLLPVFWIVLALVFLVVLPAIVAFVALVVVSLV